MKQSFMHMSIEIAQNQYMSQLMLQRILKPAHTSPHYKYYQMIQVNQDYTVKTHI